VDLGRAIEESIMAEKANVVRYKNQLNRFQREKIYLTAAINGYQAQLSTYGNLLLSSGVDITSIQKAWAELKASRAELQKTMDAMNPRLEEISGEISNINQQKVLAEKQIAELSKIDLKDETTPTLRNRAKELSRVLDEKKKIIGQLQKAIADDIEHLNRMQEAFSALSAKFENALAQRKKKHLFERQQWPLSGEAIMLLTGEVDRFVKQAGTLVRPAFWIDEFKELWKSAGLVLISLGLVFIVVLVLLHRILRIIALAEAHTLTHQLGPWHLLVLQVIHRSFMLTGVTLLLYLYVHLDLIYLATPVFQLLAGLFLVALTTRWAKRLLYFWPDQFSLPPRVAPRLQRLITTVRYFCWIHLLVGGVIGNAPAFLLLLRLVFDIWLLTWVFTFWRDGALTRRQNLEKPANGQWIMINGLCRALGYLIGGTALFLDLIGYGPLSVHWLLSWSQSTVIFLWWVGFFLLLREWDRYYREKSALERNEFLSDEYPLQWLMIRFGQLVWLISLVVALILAWGGRQIVLVRFYEGLGHPLAIGSMNFSILGVLYACLVLLITQAVARLWRWIFQAKFLNRSGMEVGLQDSITTISIYIVWMLGILIALHVFGISSASLTVAFGALGIGLGFGLQNIFNNFISGIILLFERPIQVGDDVEINGTWASVKKINVRSTVVQTYDNASLIIPNSEFISSQVTNWSFKDKRIRIKIVVGVAYGSDVALVRDTLSEIARRTPKVLKHPVPDVLFSDFGDSALIFTLRVWTDIDNMLKAATAIRFEIDRLFRERNIEIAFPQQDIHIRSTVTGGRQPLPADPGAPAVAKKEQ
jgi:small-conductance mechanosensitive channel